MGAHQQSGYQWARTRGAGDGTSLANEQNHIRYGQQQRKAGRRGGQKDRSAAQQHASNIYNHQNSLPANANLGNGSSYKFVDESHHHFASSNGHVTIENTFDAGSSGPQPGQFIRPENVLDVSTLSSHSFNEAALGPKSAHQPHAGQRRKKPGHPATFKRNKHDIISEGLQTTGKRRGNLTEIEATLPLREAPTTSFNAALSPSHAETRMKAGASELLHSATPQNFTSGNATALSNLVPQLNNQKKRTHRNLPHENATYGGGAGVSPLNLAPDASAARGEQLYAPR